jgi:hypothetical protein
MTTSSLLMVRSVRQPTLDPRGERIDDGGLHLGALLVVSAVLLLLVVATPAAGAGAILPREDRRLERTNQNRAHDPEAHQLAPRPSGAAGPSLSRTEPFLSTQPSKTGPIPLSSRMRRAGAEGFVRTISMPRPCV